MSEINIGNIDIKNNFDILLKNEYIIKLKSPKKNRNYITFTLNVILLYFEELYNKIKNNISISFENKKLCLYEISENYLYDFINENYKFNLSLKYIDDFLKGVNNEKKFEIFINK